MDSAGRAATGREGAPFVLVNWKDGDTWDLCMRRIWTVSVNADSGGKMWLLCVLSFVLNIPAVAYA